MRNDTIQSALYREMRRRGLDPKQVAEQVEIKGEVSYSHIYDYMSGRADMGSRGLHHIMDFLEMEIVRK